MRSIAGTPSAGQLQVRNCNAVCFITGFRKRAVWSRRINGDSAACKAAASGMLGSIPRCSTKVLGVVAQLVSAHACHAWGRGFESRPLRQECRPARGFNRGLRTCQKVKGWID